MKIERKERSVESIKNKIQELRKMFDVCMRQK